MAKVEPFGDHFHDFRLFLRALITAAAVLTTSVSAQDATFSTKSLTPETALAAAKAGIKAIADAIEF